MKKIITLILFIIFLGMFIYNSYEIIMWKIDSNNTDKQIEVIEKKTNIEEILDNQNTIIIEEEKEIKNNYYKEYIKMNLIDVDFKELKEINQHTVGWIKVEGTTINYPFVQTKNNKYYLKHTFDKSPNGAGWVFMDYRNNKNFDNKNTILYAHGRTNGRMFGDLKNILKSKWLNNPKNFIVKISTETENSLWQVFSVYKIPTTSDYIKTEFDNDFVDWTNILIDRSSYNFNAGVSEKDKILTLSTCYNDEEKVVLHAKLIKKENKN